MALSNRRFNVVDPEDCAALKVILEKEVTLLATAPPGKTERSDLDRMFSEISTGDPDEDRANRNYEAEQIVHPRLKAQLPKVNVWFKADCPDSGYCRFEMKVARRPEDVHCARPVFYDHNMNFMKPHHEWHKPPEAK